MVVVEALALDNVRSHVPDVEVVARENADPTVWAVVKKDVQALVKVDAIILVQGDVQEIVTGYAGHRVARGAQHLNDLTLSVVNERNQNRARMAIRVG